MVLQRFPAKLEYERNQKLSKDDVNRILKWAADKEDLRKITEEDVILFLASCNYDVEVAQNTMYSNYQFRLQHFELFGNWDPLDAELGLDKLNGCYIALPGISTDGYKVMYTKLVNQDITNFSHDRETKMFLMSHELMVHEMGAVPGWRVVYDMEDASLSMITRLKPSILKNLANYLQDYCPVQLKGIHIVHPNAFVRIMNALMRQFLRVSVANTIQIHSSLEELYNYVSKENLPKDVGGHLDFAVNLANSCSKKHILDNRDILLKNSVQQKETVQPKSERKGFWKSFWN